MNSFKKSYKTTTIISILLLLIYFWCGKKTATSNRVIIVQPFNDLSTIETEYIFKKLKLINQATILRSSLPLPTQAYYKPRNRYRADSLIKYLKVFGNSDTVVIGLTSKDISTTKGDKIDWGVMGLGYCPGNACVVSTYRLSEKNRLEQLYKVSIHELGHTQGLPHCVTKTCFMRDAEGENPLNEENDFCTSCKSFLKNKGWVLN